MSMALRAVGGLCVIALAAASGKPLNAQFASEQIPLASRGEGELNRDWRVGPAKFKDSFGGAVGLVRIQNVSPSVIRNSRFYAEYLDASGRRCFTLVFTQKRNIERITGSFLPGEVRTLYASTYYLSPAVRPVMMVLHLLSQRSAQSPAETIDASTSVLSPMGLEGGSILGERWGRVWLRAGMGGADRPFAELVLARVTVDERGELEAAVPLRTRSEPARLWFEDFIRHQRFRPATVNGTRREGTALLLVRAITSLHCVHQTIAPAWKVGWIRDSIQESSARDVAPVLTVYLRRDDEPSYWLRPLATPGRFVVVAVGTGWINPESDLKTEGEALVPTPQGPLLRKILPPAGSDSCP